MEDNLFTSPKASTYSVSAGKNSGRISQLCFLRNTCEAGMMCGTAENQVPEWRATVVVCQNSKKKRFLDVRAWLFWCFFSDKLPEYC
jgi:hypothetical protein